jgi:hypothetical protein
MHGRATRRGLWLIGLLAGIAGLAGCGDGPARPTTHHLPDFHLTDVNPNSATAGQAVSPRDYLGKVSAWYFGHAT